MANAVKSLNNSGVSLRQKIWFTFLMLMFYRLATFAAIPGINPDKLEGLTSLLGSGVIAMFDLFTGGAVRRMSVLALGIMPYITSSIVLQLIVASTPSLKHLKSEGESGQAKINQYTKYLAIVVALFQGFAVSSTMAKGGIYYENTLMQQILTTVCICAGTMLILWIGEQISERGIGNGVSMIIAISILSGAPHSVKSLFELTRSGAIGPASLLFVVLVFVATLFFIVFMERGMRMIPIQYAQQRHHFLQANRQVQDQRSNFLPFKVNTAGVVPPIFASALLLIPSTIVAFGAGSENSFLQWLSINMTHGRLFFTLFYASLIVFFTFFYNSLVFDTKDTSENLKKAGAFIPGIRPGATTAAHLKTIIMRLSLIGAVYLVIVCTIPETLAPIYGYNFLLGGTGILIVINVIIDTVTQVQSYVLSGKYDKIMSERYNFGKGKK